MMMPPRQPRTPAQISHPHPALPTRSDGERAATFARAGIRLAVTPDTGEAARRWEAHLDAGRIGVPPPAPLPSPGRDYRLASLTRILGHGARGGA